MKHRISFLPAAVFVVAVAATAPMAADAEPDEGMTSIRIITVSSRIGEPRSVRVEQRNGGLWVTGMIKKRFRGRRRSMGYVNLEFLDGTGKVVASKEVRLSPTLWSKNRRWKRFSIVLDEFPAGVQSVRVRHDPGAPAQGKC